MDFYNALQSITKSAERNAPMSEHTSFKIGGAADFLVEPKTADEIKAIIALCKNENVPYTILGNGSNVLVSDEGIEGVVIKIADSMASVEVHGCEIYASAGVLLSVLARAAARAGLSGLEFASGIPGTLGGAVVMNAGAYGGEMKDVITRVGFIDADGSVGEIEAEACDFGYRRSIFSSGEKVIIYCHMTLKEGNQDEIIATMAELNQRRRDKQPLLQPSAGSTFKRPEGHFAGKLIEDAGLKGFRVGGAEVSTKHSGFVVNAENATAADVKALMAEVQRIVKEKFDVDLQPEVKFLGR